MSQDKMHLINKIFNNKTIKNIWDKENEKYYICVVDIISALTDSINPRHYWNVLKGRLKNEGNETVTNCDQLKLKAQYGNYRLTDVVDIENMFRIIEIHPLLSSYVISVKYLVISILSLIGISINISL